MDQSIDKQPPCRVCGSNEGYQRVLHRLDRCRVCDFVTFNDLSPNDLLDIYDDAYFAGNEYPDYVGQQDALRRSMRSHLNKMWRYHPRLDSLLEVGCAYGLFLDEARTYFRSVAGVDICITPTAYARERLGLHVDCDDFLTMDFGNQRFDIVCFWDTIEHLPAPEAYLEKARQVLAPEGMVFLTTGDISSFNARLRGSNWRQIHPPSHLHYFSRKTITHLLDRVGFKVVGIETTSYYHTAFNVLASIRLRGGMGGSIASMSLAALGEKLARRLGLWINLADIMFVAAQLKQAANS